MDSTWRGQADVPVLGPEDISPNEMAAILSKGLGRPVRYQQTNRSVQEQDGQLRDVRSLRYEDIMTAKNKASITPHRGRVEDSHYLSRVDRGCSQAYCSGL